MRQTTLSLCLIACNEEDLLPDCLARVVPLVDEVVVVDTGSCDRTAEIAQEAGAHVLTVGWTDDFAVVRNAARGMARGAWILVLDADERLPSVGHAEIRSFIERDDVDGALLPLYNADRLDRTPAEVIEVRADEPTLVLRLFRNTPDLRWEGAIHEFPQAWLRSRVGRVEPIDAPIVHYGHVPEVRARKGKDERDLRMLRAWVERSPEDPRGLGYLVDHLATRGREADALELSERLWEVLVRRFEEGEGDCAVIWPVTIRTKLLFNAAKAADAIEGLERFLGWVAGHPIHDGAQDHPNIRFFVAHGHEVQALRARPGALRAAHLQAACEGYQAALECAGRIYEATVDQGVSGWLARYRLALCLLQLGQWEAAIETLAAFEEARPGTPEATLALAEAEIGLGRVGDAVARLSSAGESESVDERILRHVAEGHRGGARQGPSDIDDARLLAGHRRAHAVRIGRVVPPEEPAFVFIGGAGRSGTTLLRAMLHAHPRLQCGPEVKLVPELLRARERWGEIYAPALRGAGVDADLLDRSSRAFLTTLLGGLTPAGARLVEKTPGNAAWFASLDRLFPSARFIHVLRDGRAVVASLLRQDWFDPATGRPLAITQDARVAAAYWRDAVLTAREQCACVLGAALEVRYEELVTTPEPTMRRVLEFLGEEWSGQVLEHEQSRDLVLPAHESSSTEVSSPVHPDSIGRWRDELSVDDVRAIEDEAGPLLEVLGFARSV